jgi:hypothetical protein
MIDQITESFIALLGQHGVTGDPCDEWQVHDLEQQLKVSLPAAFKAFLLLAGQSFRPFDGSFYLLDPETFDWHSPRDLQQRANWIMQKSGQSPPPDAFVFFVHFGTAFRFFFLNDGDDPPVFEFVEKSTRATQLARRFSDFLLDEVRQSAELSRRTDGRPTKG